MAISFHPKAGQVLFCDFKGYIFPEIIKKRPVVVITPRHLVRSGLCTVVPLSTTPPYPPLKYHYRLSNNPIPNSTESEVWAKCDLVATVCLDRLDRIKTGHRKYTHGSISIDEVEKIRRAAAYSLGIEIS